MGFWLFLLGVLVLVWWSSSRNKQAETPPYVINQQWMDYLAETYRQAKKPAEKALLQKLLQDLLAQGMPAPIQPLDGSFTHAKNVTMATGVTAEAGVQTHRLSEQSGNVVNEPAQRTQITREPIDNATLLLYFGAFLFLVAAGLFVALAGENGSLRVGIIAATSMVLYGGGLWLFGTKPKLKVPAYTFVGMGMMLAPLAGLAAYAYVFKDSGSRVWLVTSMVCAALYSHALRTLRHPLLEYILLGTFVSLFESSVSILQLPVYYYGWALTVVALVFTAWQIAHRQSLDLDRPNPLISNILVPASIGAGLYGLPTYGSWQVGVSLVLAAVYYALQAWRTSDETRQVTAVLSQVVGSAGVAVLAYQVDYQYAHSGLALAVCGLVAVALWQWLNEAVRFNATTLGVALMFVGMCMAWQNPSVQLGLAVATVLASLWMWLRQNRPDLYGAGGLVALTIPYLYGLQLAEGGVSRPTLALLVAATTGVFVAFFYGVRKSQYDTEAWRNAHRVVASILMLAVLVTILGASAWQVLATGVGLAVLGLVLHKSDEQYNFWLTVSVIVALAPVFFTWHDTRVFLASVLLAWGWCVALALEYRVEVARWFGSAAWLLLPVAIAHHWTWLQSANWYATGYLVSMIGFILARSIAKSRLSKLALPLADLEKRLKSESWSYVVGYSVSGAVAYIVALDGVWFLPVIVAMVVASAAYIVSRVVERAPEIMAVVPFLLQAGIWAVDYNDAYTSWLVAISALVVVALYGLSLAKGRANDGTYNDFLGKSAQCSAWIAPLSVLFVDTTVWSMPVSLIVAGGLLLHFVWPRSQNEREFAGAVAVVGMLWLTYFLGVRELQAYTHSFGALFALYAWWRAKRGEQEPKDAYTIAALTAVTVPLGMQLLSGGIGGVYGWWFLGEQVAIMLLGMVLNSKLVTRWGLYVAVGAVLYQLRALAWLALAVLAMFLIGLAVYQIQKSDR